MVTRKFKITYMAQIVAYIVFWLDSFGLEAPSDVSLSLKIVLARIRSYWYSVEFFNQA